MKDLSPEIYYCSYEQRMQNKNCCIHTRANIFSDNWKQPCPITDWNDFCSKCQHGNFDIGIYGSGTPYQKNFTNDFENKSAYIIDCRSEKKLLSEVLPRINPKASAIVLNNATFEDFSFFENFSVLRYISIYSTKATKISWDLDKTPILEQLCMIGKNFFDLSGLEKARRLRSFHFPILTSRMDRQLIKSLEPLSKLPLLEDVRIEGAKLVDENIDHLISIPNLKKLFVSPDTYSMEAFAKFEAKKFKINERYGFYAFDDDEVWKYGNDVRPRIIPTSNKNKIDEYFKKYHELMQKYKNE